MSEIDAAILGVIILAFAGFIISGGSVFDLLDGANVGISNKPEED